MTIILILYGSSLDQTYISTCATTNCLEGHTFGAKTQKYVSKSNQKSFRRNCQKIGQIWEIQWSARCTHAQRTATLDQSIPRMSDARERIYRSASSARCCLWSSCVFKGVTHKMRVTLRNRISVIYSLFVCKIKVRFLIRATNFNCM